MAIAIYSAVYWPALRDAKTIDEIRRQAPFGMVLKDPDTALAECRRPDGLIQFVRAES